MSDFISVKKQATRFSRERGVADKHDQAHLNATFRPFSSRLGSNWFAHYSDRWYQGGLGRSGELNERIDLITKKTGLMTHVSSKRWAFSFGLPSPFYNQVKMFSDIVDDFKGVIL